MAFWKMEGFEVTPTTPSSIILCNAPFSTRSSRLMESIQIPCPNSAAFFKFSFISCLLVHGWEPVRAPIPSPPLPVRPILRSRSGVSLGRVGVLDRGRSLVLADTLRTSEQGKGLVRHVLWAYPELLQQFLARRGGPVALDPDAAATEADVALPSARHPGLHRDARLDGRRQDGILVLLVLGVEDLPRWHAHHAGVDPLFAE